MTATDLPPGTPDCVREFAQRNPGRVVVGGVAGLAGTSKPVKTPAGKPTARPALVAAAVADLPGGGVAFTLPVATASEANGRDWRARSARTTQARAVVSRCLGPHLRRLAPFADHYHAGRPLGVRLVRLGGRRLDRTANLGPALKAVEDAVALMLGADDGDPRWQSEADQEPGGPAGVRVEFARLGPGATE